VVKLTLSDSTEIFTGSDNAYTWMKGETLDIVPRDTRDIFIQRAIKDGLLKFSDEKDKKQVESEWGRKLDVKILEKIKEKDVKIVEPKPVVEGIVKLKLVTRRSYCADQIGALWTSKGQVVSIKARDIRDWDIDAGIKKGILKVIEEKEEEKEEEKGDKQ